MSASLDIHVLTADTRGTAAEELTGLPVQIHRLEPGNEDVQKRDFAAQWDLRSVAAFGNVANDSLMLQGVKVAGSDIAVDNSEACAIDALVNAEIFIVGAANALDL